MQYNTHKHFICKYNYLCLIKEGQNIVDFTVDGMMEYTVATLQYELHKGIFKISVLKMGKGGKMGNFRDAIIYFLSQ